MKIRWQRVLRLTIFAVIATWIAVDFGAAWIYVDPLIWPGCWDDPVPLKGYPDPEDFLIPLEGGEARRGWYSPSQNGAAIIALGGLTGSLGDQLPPVAMLLDAGYGVLQLENRNCSDLPVTLGYHEADEAGAAAQILLTRPEIERVGVWGFSMGGVAAIRAGARYPEITAILAEGGYYNLGDDLVGKGSSEPLPRKIFLYTLAGVFWLRTGINPWDSSPIDDLAQISPRPVFLIYGEHEAESGHAQAQFNAANEPKTLWIVPNGDHGTNPLAAPEQYRQRVLEFFGQTLYNTAE